MFTGVMVFVVLGIRLSLFAKSLVCALLFASMVPFGGRSALIVAIAGLGLLGMAHLASSRVRSQLTMNRIFVLLSVVMIVPVAFCAGLYFLLNSEMGERLSTESKFNDESAGARILVWHVFEFMTPEEFILGMAPERTTGITEKMSQSLDLVLIENPWILMFMHLGLIFFPLWFLSVMALAGRMMYRAPPALKMAVVAYFAIASTNNSFAVKGSVHLLLISAIICGTRSLLTQQDEVNDFIAVSTPDTVEPTDNQHQGAVESLEARWEAIGKLIGNSSPRMKP